MNSTFRTLLECATFVLVVWIIWTLIPYPPA